MQLRMCDNFRRPMKPSVLVTKRIYPEAIKYLQEHAEVDYANSATTGSLLTK